jgi:DNA-binding NarL/FixJ family response regulator
MGSKIKIFIVEDHPVVYDGLKMILNHEKDFEVCGIATNTDDAMMAIKKLQPDFVLADISLKGSSSGIDLTERLSKEYPKIKVLILSMHDELSFAERAINAGAKGYLMKNEMVVKVIEAIRQIMNGSLYLSEKMQSQFLSLYLMKQKKSVNPLDVLTNRELEVLRLLGQGMNSEKTAKLLQISKKTVDTYKLRIKEKLNIGNNTELMKMGIEIISQEKVL